MRKVTNSIGQCLLFLDGLKGLSASYRAAYRSDLARFARYCRFEGVQPLEADVVALRQLLAHAQAEGLGDHRLRRLRSNIEGFFNFARRFCLVDDNPMFVIRRREDATRLLERLPRATSRTIDEPSSAITFRDSPKERQLRMGLKIS